MDKAINDSSLKILRPLNLGRAIVCMALVFAQGTTRAQPSLKKVGDLAENFELNDAISGEPFSLSDARGSIILLDFFFYW
ncbi:peroxiredoxin family protein [Verrucomicrobia bacterium]|jgi:cytochrome oxidase Cu insertion factor (SCO1/SenC/PrrC family)|nr:peroxiredoxin family protein [Verrucomicrobiota bacterium]MDG1891651.1 hypothetical protein [Verrucomicrobiota bacterium]